MAQTIIIPACRKVIESILADNADMSSTRFAVLSDVEADHLSDLHYMLIVAEAEYLEQKTPPALDQEQQTA